MIIRKVDATPLQGDQSDGDVLGRFLTRSRGATGWGHLLFFLLANDILKVHGPVRIDDHPRIEIGQGNPSEMDIEWVDSNVDLAECEGFPFQEIFGICLVNGNETANGRVSLIHQTGSLPLQSAHGELASRGDTTLLNEDFDPIRKIGLEG